MSFITSYTHAIAKCVQFHYIIISVGLVLIQGATILTASSLSNLELNFESVERLVVSFHHEVCVHTNLWLVTCFNTPSILLDLVGQKDWCLSNYLQACSARRVERERELKRCEEAGLETISLPISACVLVTCINSDWYNCFYIVILITFTLYLTIVATAWHLTIMHGICLFIPYTNRRGCKVRRETCHAR